jgi:SAM-dependent methyltransferase
MIMMDAEDYKSQWNKIYAEAYAQGRRHWRPDHATPPPFVQFMQSKWAPAAGARILEAGCGDGLNSIALARAGFRVTGIDVVESAITRAKEAAREHEASVDFYCLDLVYTGPPESGRYDLWVDIKTLHTLWEDRHREGYLKTAADALHVGGVLFLNCGLALLDVKEYFPEVFAKLDPATKGGADVLDRDLPREKWQGIRCETLDWYCHELEHAGFEIYEARREAAMETGWGVVIVAGKKC